MGGNTFKTAGPGGTPLDVPRMGSKLYNKLSQDLQSKLKKVFRLVTVPRDSPGKVDHGDIDILVSGAMCAWNADMLKSIIGATHVSPNGRTTSLAIPHPEREGYVQVDIEVAPGEGTAEIDSLFRWTNFMKSDGDLMQLVGICHRGLGLRNNDRGLHLIVEEIATYNRKKGLLFLTQDPDEVMRFYGYDTAKYWQGFQSEEDLFQWVVSSRFFNPALFENRVETANDRARQKKRAMYNRFVDDFMPQLVDIEDAEPEHDTQRWTRKEVLEEALKVFDKHEEYNAMIHEHELKNKNEKITELVKEILPATKSRVVVMRSLRRWVYFADGKPYISPVANLYEDRLWSEALTDDDKVKDFLEWVRQNWEQVKALEQQRVKGTRSDVTEASTSSPPSLVFDYRTPSTVPGTPNTVSRSDVEAPALPSTPQISAVLSPAPIVLTGTPETPNRTAEGLTRKIATDYHGDTVKGIPYETSATQQNISRNRSPPHSATTDSVRAKTVQGNRINWASDVSSDTDDVSQVKTVQSKRVNWASEIESDTD